MDAPKCKLCGHRHWNTEPHNFKTKPKEASDAKNRKQKIGKRPRKT
jgi:hypothetical protein